MKESQYTTYMKKKYLKKYPKCFWYKIPDSMGVDGQKRPFDIFIVRKGIGMIAIEAKISNTLSPFSMSKVEPHQIDSLRRVSAQEGVGYLVIGVRSILKELDRRVIGRDDARMSMDIWINIDDLPGEGPTTPVKALKIREIARDFAVLRNKSNEIFMPSERLEAYFKQPAYGISEDDAGEAVHPDRGFG